MMPTHALPVIPVIDLRGGHVVRAVRGDRAAYRPVVSRLVAGSAPCDVAAALLERARAFADAAVPAQDVSAPAPARGSRIVAPVLYVADLDALEGRAPQSGALRALLHAHPGLELWIDAGFADVAAADALARAVGPDAARLRFVFGSESLADRAALAALAGRAGAILSLDGRHARPLDAAGCWEAPEHWPATVIVMTLDRVGSGAGPDLATFARLRALAPHKRWIGAGGVRDAADLRAAAAAGAAAWLVASALHDATLTPG